MDVREFRAKIKPESKLIVDNKEYNIEEIVKFRFDDSSYYIKCYLIDGFVFADDDNENIYVLVKPIFNQIKEPFPKNLDFDNKKFKFLYKAHAIAETAWGDQKYFSKGGSEKFYDYQADDGSYLSLGVNDQTGKRADFYGKIIKPEAVKLK